MAADLRASIEACSEFDLWDRICEASEFYEGVDAQIHGRTVLGDRKVSLAPVPRVAGTPRIVVHARTVFGDLKLRSLAPGESASRWRQVMERIAYGSRSKGTAE